MNEEDEKKFWTMRLLRKNCAKSLLNVVYLVNKPLQGAGMSADNVRG